MASPTLDLLCCSYVNCSSANMTNKPEVVPSCTIDPAELSVLVPADNSKCHRYFYLYNGIVITMSTFSVLGSIYVLFPRKRDTSNLDSVIRPGLREIRQKWILFWLFFADIMACLGLIVLSGESFHILGGNCLTNKQTSKSWKWPCILATAWVNFFFLATYLWITCYTIDVYLFLKKSRVKHTLRIYFVVSWLFPIIYVSLGLWALCDSSNTGNKTLLKVYYLCSFIPMVLVLIVNPVLSILAVRKVSSLMRGRGMYTDREREVERQVKQKFLKIVIVLEICWFPNVINGILLLSDSAHEDACALYATIWIFMAILNPLQAFLNTLVYWAPMGCCSHPPWTDAADPPWRDAADPIDTETTCLLSGSARDALN